jgi:carbonic anhydrase/acetyltransferase-like protein (isoleucine patch superfamily)
VIPPHSLVLGVPAKVVRELGPDEENGHRRLAGKYVRLQHNVRRG